MIFLVLFFLAGRPIEFAQEAAFFQGFLIEKPVIRIALDIDLEDALIHASSGMKIYQAADSYKLLAEDVAEARVKGHKEALTEKFLIQAAQSRRREEAEKIASELRLRIDRSVTVAGGRPRSWRASTRSWWGISSPGAKPFPLSGISPLSVIRKPGSSGKTSPGARPSRNGS
jgi:hypothetical protein